MKKKDLNRLLGRPTTLSEKFHEKTKFKKMPKNIDSKLWPEEWVKTYYKSYSRLDEIILPHPEIRSGISLKETFLKRHSERNFSKEPVEIDTLGNFLYYSCGIRQGKEWESRFYPSPGARYPLEVYVVTLNILGLSKGVYHYYVKNHSLEKLLLFDKFDFNKYFNQDWIKQAAFIVIITAVFDRNLVKYGQRGYRYILFEAGHIAQNMYLLSLAFNISCCAVGGFADDKINALLDTDGLNESVVYVLAQGSEQK